MLRIIITLQLILIIPLFLSAGEFVRHGGADEVMTSCLESDREALLDFKKCLKDSDLLLSTWRGSNCCQWWGIRCQNGTGAVTHVDLHNLNLEILDGDYSNRYGFWELSVEKKPLKSLKYLDLSSNRFFLAPIPEFFGSLQNLQYLNLSYAEFTGQIPSSLGNLSSLQYLDLSGNFILSKVPDWLVNVSSLTTINMANCGLYGRIPLGLADLPNLEILRLNSNSLDASSFQLLRGRWEKIQILDLGSNRIRGRLPTSIGSMSTSLTYLDLSYNDVQGGIPSSIGKLCNLKFFSLAGNNLTGTLPESLEETRNYVSRSPLTSLQYLDLSNNQLSGRLPKWLGQLENLIELVLYNNSLNGPIPDSLHLLQNLKTFDVSWNRLNGTLPISIGQLSSLSFLYVRSNHLTGVVSETHFLKHTKLEVLDLSLNSFKLDMGSNWVPPFQIRILDMISCCLGFPFPAWLKSQKKIEYLDFSNDSVSGSIPHWFWKSSPSLKFLNISFNKLEGQIPSSFEVNETCHIVDFSHNLFEGPLTLPVGKNMHILDLSHNKFSGSIPKNLSVSLPNLIFLSLADNQIEGEIPASIGCRALEVIDLSSNNLIGTIPPNIGNNTSLHAIDLSKNSLSGTIPSMLGHLHNLQTLHLSENMLFGQIPSWFQNMSTLETLDLESNRLLGRIPRWIGEGFLDNLRILSLRSNEFSGELPSTLSNLSSLHVLDVADNQLNGTVPSTFGDFKGMIQAQNILKYLLYGKFRNKHYEENMVVNMKGQPLPYTRTLSLVISLDLSGNNLSGDFPVELTKLLGLVVLDLSRNYISGHIPVNISKWGQLLSLDLSGNRLSGPIPRSLSSLSFLEHLNLSNNGFSGMIPYIGQLTTFDASSFDGNPGLCGGPLDVRCADDNDDHEDSNREWFLKDSFIDKWFYLSVGLGFAAGLIVPFLVMAARRSWSNAYFGLVDKVAEMLWFLKHKTVRHIRSRRRRHNNAV